jgi:hypothetical protein
LSDTLNKKEAVVFIKTIQPGEMLTFSERVKSDGTIEQVKIRFFRGQQKTLLVRPYVQHKGNKIEDLITYPEDTDQALSGDDDNLNYETIVPVQYDDNLKVWVKNTDGVNAYTLHVSVMIDYYGGTQRVV